MQLNVQIKQADKKENKIVRTKVEINDSPSNIKELITATVVFTYREYYDKPRESDVFYKDSKRPTEDEAIATAIQAFEDGLVAVFIDSVRYENLIDKIDLTGDEIITFVQLTMLVGRMW